MISREALTILLQIQNYCNNADCMDCQFADNSSLGCSVSVPVLWDMEHLEQLCPKDHIEDGGKKND